MSRNAAFRLLAFAVLLGALKIAGLVDFALPWGDPSFQISGVTVLLYLAWSLASAPSRERGGSMSLESFAPYAVLLVSAVDGMLLGLTPIPCAPVIRWIGPAMFAAGAAASLLCGSRAGRWASALRLFGLPVGFSSIAGLVVAVPAFIAAGSAAGPAHGEGTGEEEDEGPRSEG